MIEIIGAPFDLCGMQLGSRLGPTALRLANLESELASIGLRVTDAGDIAVSNEPRSNPDGLKNFPPLLEAIRNLRSTALRSLKTAHCPVVLGGEHTLATAGISAALEHFGDDLGVLWIDAHADINTPGMSESGNIHGMPIAALQGLESGVEGQRDADWSLLVKLLGPRHLKVENVVWYGLRDVDIEEQKVVKQGLPISMHHIDRFGIERTVEQIDARFRELGVRNIWISFDVDALDPILAPGTGTAVRGGLSYRESHLMAEILAEKLATSPYRLVGIDLVETNPLTDTNNQTAKRTVEWILSLFGKTILGK